jgi:hypothetical protein
MSPWCRPVSNATTWIATFGRSATSTSRSNWRAITSRPPTGRRSTASFNTTRTHDAFNELAQELHRADAHVVVVPTLGHLARNAGLLNTMLLRLELDAQAEVFELGETA